MQGALQNAGANENIARPAVHESYRGRDTKSAMQLAMSTAKFVDTRPGAPKAEAPLMIEEDKEPAKAVKVNPSLQSQLNAVFEQESFADIELPDAAAAADPSAYSAEDIVGGISDPDRWKTTTQMLNNGETLTAKKVTKRTLNISSGVMNPTLVSPITGLKLGNYESNMVEIEISPGQKVMVTLAEAAEIEADRREKREKDKKQREAEEEAADTTDPLIKRLKKALAARGASGLLGLQKKFKHFDTDGSGALDMREFRRAMKETKVALSEAELVQLFGQFDAVGTGLITADVFMRRIVGSLSVRRRRYSTSPFLSPLPSPLSTPPLPSFPSECPII